MNLRSFNSITDTAIEHVIQEQIIGRPIDLIMSDTIVQEVSQSYEQESLSNFYKLKAQFLRDLRKEINQEINGVGL
jgi:hypothetical protein